MLGSQFMTDEELRREIRRLTRNVEKRISRIEDLGEQNAIQDAAKVFREYQKELPKDLKKVVRTQDLVKYYRRVKRINDLKTSKISGAKSALNTIGKVRSYLDTLSEDKRKKFWEAYHKFYEYSNDESYKYEVMAEILDETMSGEDVETTVSDIIEKYTEAQIEAEEYGGTDEAIRISFTKRLRSLSDF